MKVDGVLQHTYRECGGGTRGQLKKDLRASSTSHYLHSIWSCVRFIFEQSSKSDLDTENLFLATLWPLLTMWHWRKEVKIKYYLVTLKCFYYYNIIVQYDELIVLWVLLTLNKQIHLSVSHTCRIYTDECKMYHSLKCIPLDFEPFPRTWRLFIASPACVFLFFRHQPIDVLFLQCRFTAALPLWLPSNEPRDLIGQGCAFGHLGPESQLVNKFCMIPRPYSECKNPVREFTFNPKGLP